METETWYQFILDICLIWNSEWKLKVECYFLRNRNEFLPYMWSDDCSVVNIPIIDEMLDLWAIFNLITSFETTMLVKTVSKYRCIQRQLIDLDFSFLRAQPFWNCFIFRECNSYYHYCYFMVTLAILRVTYRTTRQLWSGRNIFHGISFFRNRIFLNFFTQ